MLTSCAGTKKTTLHLEQPQTEQPETPTNPDQAKIDALASRITQLVDQARLENPETTSLDALYQLSQDPNIPEFSRGQAAIAYAMLLFDFDRPDAFYTGETTAQTWANHPDAPKLHLLLAYQWDAQDNAEAAMRELTNALGQPNIDADTLQEIIELAQPLLNQVSEETSIQWLLAISLHDTARRQQWLKQAARYASLSRVLQIRQAHPLQPEQADFYRFVAQERLMLGDTHAVRVIAKILQADMPGSEAARVVQAWAESEGQALVVGVMLPLTGKYAVYGEQALRGIRLAMSRADFEQKVILRIQDTAGDLDNTISAYYHLLAQGAQWIIGPLLSQHTDALVPYLVEHVPVIALSNHVEIAAQSPALFMHSMAKTVQADFMARYAREQGKQRMVIIYDDNNSATEETAAFAQTFMDHGGDVIDMVALEEGVRDYRPAFVAMRSRTDDEVLLASLEEDLYFFGPELDMDIVMPLNMDAVYIAAPGRRIAVLAGQLAYSGIARVQFYGSHRWDDGHLLDDKGRYLNHAEFATPLTNLAQPDPTILDIQNQYRSIWADRKHLSALFALAYDTAMNVAALGSRLGLTRQDAIDALHDTPRFPAISGSYHFDAQGISQKTFAIQRVWRGKLQSIQPEK